MATVDALERSKSDAGREEDGLAAVAYSLSAPRLKAAMASGGVSQRSATTGL